MQAYTNNLCVCLCAPWDINLINSTTQKYKKYALTDMVANERPKHAYTSIATSIYSLRQSADFFFSLRFYAFILSLFNIKQSFGTRNTNKWYMSMWCAVFIEKILSCFFLSVLLCPATFLFACTILPLMWWMWSDMSLKCDVLKHVMPVSIFDFRQPKQSENSANET